MCGRFKRQNIFNHIKTSNQIMVINILQKLSYRYSSHDTIIKYIDILVVNNRFIMLLICIPQIWEMFNFIIFIYFYFIIFTLFIFLTLVYFGKK